MARDRLTPTAPSSRLSLGLWRRVHSLGCLADPCIQQRRILHGRLSRCGTMTEPSTSDTVGVRVGSEVVTCDAGGSPRQWFGPGETVYVKGTWFEPNTPYWMWIQDDPVLEGDALVSGEDPSGSQEKVTTALADGSFGPVEIWTVPSTEYQRRLPRVRRRCRQLPAVNTAQRYDGLASFSVTPRRRRQ